MWESQLNKHSHQIKAKFGGTVIYVLQTSDPTDYYIELHRSVRLFADKVKSDGICVVAVCVAVSIKTGAFRLLYHLVKH